MTRHRVPCSNCGEDRNRDVRAFYVKVRGRWHPVCEVCAVLHKRPPLPPEVTRRFGRAPRLVVRPTSPIYDLFPEAQE